MRACVCVRACSENYSAGSNDCFIRNVLVLSYKMQSNKYCGHSMKQTFL